MPISRNNIQLCKRKQTIIDKLSLTASSAEKVSYFLC
jgi:hypothetical protein